MVIEVKTYMCPYNLRPDLNDIEHCINIAKENNCAIELKWQVKYDGGYSRYIYSDSNAQEIFDKLPKYYGL